MIWILSELHRLFPLLDLVSVSHFTPNCYWGICSWAENNCLILLLFWQLPEMVLDATTHLQAKSISQACWIPNFHQIFIVCNALEVYRWLLLLLLFLFLEKKNLNRCDVRVWWVTPLAVYSLLHVCIFYPIVFTKAHKYLWHYEWGQKQVFTVKSSLEGCFFSMQR